MVNLAAPFWLVGLTTLPLIWWLHRLRASGSELTVAAIFLWRQAPPAAGSGQRRAKAEPHWWLRVLIMTSLVLALAEPQWLSRTPRIAVWIDDSLSMFTRENNATRVELGIEQLVTALQTRGAGEVIVHSLASPGINLTLTPGQTERWPVQLRAWLESPRGEPKPPPSIQMAQDSEHWLISDGASPGIAEWLRTAPVSRVLTVGEERLNATVTTLALRPALRARAILKGLAVVNNTGPEPLKRKLVLRLDGRELFRKRLLLAAQSAEAVELDLPAGTGGRLQAELEPADALTLDDTLVVAVPTPITVVLHGSCGRHLRTALNAHPQLQLLSAEQAHDVAVACTPERPAQGKPSLLFHAAGAALPVTGTPQWSAQAGPLARLILESDWLRHYPTSSLPEQQVSLLTASGQPLIAYGATPVPRIEVLLDMEEPTFARRPEYLTLLDSLLTRILGQPVLETLNSVRRSPIPSRIAPTALTPSSQPIVANGHSIIELSGFLIGLAGLLVLIDFWRLHKRSRTVAI